MKEEFIGFYPPTSEEINDSWKNGTFIFDANALLNLYRYSESTRKDFLIVIKKLENNLFMPYQVGFEYHNNRLNVINGLSTSYKTIENEVTNTFNKNFDNHLKQFLRHPSIDVERLKKVKNDFIDKITSELKKQQKTHPDFSSTDEILNQLSELYKGKVNKKNSKDDLDKIYLDGKKRYDNSIPPGYKDYNEKIKKGEQNAFGDLIIWKEIISYANEKKKPIILITDDRKEDWWTIENGKTVRPREELIKEFYDLTGIRILIYNADSFLHFAKERELSTDIKETSISEIKDVREADEKMANLHDLIMKYNNHAVVQKNHNPLSSSLAELVGSDVLNIVPKNYNPLSSSLSELVGSGAYNIVPKNYNPLSSSLSELVSSGAYNIVPKNHNPLSSSFSELISSGAYNIVLEYNNTGISSLSELASSGAFSIDPTEPSYIKTNYENKFTEEESKDSINDSK